MSSHWECPLCLETLNDAVETSCGHAFCAGCILRVWETDREQRPIRCPIDRRNVSMLIPSYALRAGVDAYRRETGQAVEPEAGPAGQHDAKVDEYNQRYLNADRPVMQRVQEDWVLFNRVMSGDLTLRKILTTITICLGVLYLFVPFDLIPDSAGLVGLFDDLVVWLAIVWFVVALLESYRQNLAEHQQRFQ
ncbi:zinc finger, C3HC4 type (RING finger) domain containing protein [Acanthamoeba castellanii str. Neff]|uniref:E3 ubiquitin-protein ligase RNF170 n=1 Tax=Acanthamoeba castellanii (strain ATCC 30010 / Neff) TaxID=1257118 RepID=L8GM30_ACACF|nr:zinc finger, C3HC4 type (RING finger) domain containing protein [Acanthamoeba castellanii str. Neff]ELR14095.1 zinc finger, C3HC4 type (RING finger) domain containing protein [Acanthamoeba castellanii str. Neff]